MNNKSMIIIGAGVAGLSTGCYARMNGYKTHIYELHTALAAFVLPGSAKVIQLMVVYTGYLVANQTRLFIPFVKS
ncbi:NAD(P)-binding protein [Desulfotomaculum sp. 1211_IL3151]|uniref:NAD(P)-binding protein n=1 Tax=Desulfotomaculum sp. 1211_IL3151 TaxID=3084055 RepID=UPI002FDA6D0F